MLTRLIAYARGLAARRRIEAEADEELAFHLEQETEANVARGLSPAEARRDGARRPRRCDADAARPFATCGARRWTSSGAIVRHALPLAARHAVVHRGRRSPC